MSGTSPPDFSFIGHPRDEADIFRARPLTLLRMLSSSDEDFVARALSLPPFLLGEVTVGFGPFHGEVLTITCLPHDVLTPRGLREIDAAVQLAVESGATVIGLGALTAPATRGGRDLVDRVPRGVTLTNGNAFTAAVLVEQVREAAARLQTDRPPCVAVVGCTGSIGKVASRLLATDGADLVLIGRTAERSRAALADLAGNARFSGDVADAADADVVLLLTSSPEVAALAGHVGEGTLVIDAAEPPGLPDGLDGGHYVRGARVRIDGYRCTYDFGFERPDETFACLAETYLFVREGIREHSVGSPDPALVARLARAARRHGAAAAPLELERHAPAAR